MTRSSGMPSVTARHFVAALDFQDDLRAYFYRVTQNVTEVDDLLQETFIRLLEVGERTDYDVQGLRFYVFTIARHLAIDWLHQRKRIPLEQIADMRELMVPDHGADPESLLSAHEDIARVQRAADLLSPRCREVFRLHKIEGYTRQEIAEQLGVAERTVNNQLWKAAIRFKRLLFDGALEPQSWLLKWLGRLNVRRKKGVPK